MFPISIHVDGEKRKQWPGRRFILYLSWMDILSQQQKRKKQKQSKTKKTKQKKYTLC